MDILTKSLKNTEDTLTNTAILLNVVRGDFPLIEKKLETSLSRDTDWGVPADEVETMRSELAKAVAEDIEYDMVRDILFEVSSCHSLITIPDKLSNEIQLSDYKKIADHIDTLKNQWGVEEMTIIMNPTAYTILMFANGDELDRSVIDPVTCTLMRGGTIRGASILVNAKLTTDDLIIYAKKGWLKVNADRIVWTTGVKEGTDGEMYHLFSTDVTTKIDPVCISLVRLSFPHRT